MTKDEAVKNAYEKGFLEGKIGFVMQALEELGSIPKDLQRKIEQQEDAKVLDSWIRLSLKVDDIQEFEDLM